MKIAYLIILLFVINWGVWYAKNMDLIYITNSIEMNKPSTQSVICCLTRGYNDVNKYDTLIERNKSLSNLPWAYKYDHIIFHEGNINTEHQNYISSRTTLPLRFVNIEQTFMRPAKKVTDESICKQHNTFSKGYKRMCRFWFVDFWNYVNHYEYLIRFDEDVSLNKNCKDPIEYCRQNNLHYVCPFLMNEKYHVIDGLDRFINQSYDKINKVPGTHTQMIHIPYYMNNPNVKQFIHRIDQCGCILHNRWGDAPLMGILVRDFTNEHEYNFNWEGFKGYHGSHNKTY